ncbi:gem-associated protein 8 isoform X1 [Lampetra fluviatilis]
MVAAPHRPRCPTHGGAMAGREEEATAATGGSAWYTHPVYARYWSHYRGAQAWTQRHRNARRRALTEAAQGLDWSCLVGLPFPYDPSHPYAASHHGPQSHPPQAAGHQRRHHQQQHHYHHQHHHHHQKHEEVPEHHHFSTQATEHQREHQQHHHHNQQQQHHYHQHHQKHEEVPEHHHFSIQATEHQREHQQHHHHNQQQQQRQHWQQQLIEEVPDLRSEEPDEDSESELESEAESDVEITDELRAYFAETERHREERRLEQEQEDERVEGMVWADEPPGARQASSRAPQERPGERRRVEMARLYGEEACVRILALEAAMQLSFDQQCDRTRPKYWPIIPLKL